MHADLLARLKSDDEEIRYEAREELALEMDDDIARVYLDLARSDAAEDVRADVIVGLGPVIEEAGDEYFEGAVPWAPELGPPISREMFDTIRTELRAIYDDPAQPVLVRRRALEVLVRDPQEWQVGEIRKHHSGGDESWKLTAVFCMGHMPGFESELAELVGTASGPLLFEAVRGAGMQGVRAVADRIRVLAESPLTELDLRLAAIEALPWVDSDCEELLDKLAASKDPEIAAVADAALEDLDLVRMEEEERDEEGDEEDEGEDEKKD